MIPAIQPLALRPDVGKGLVLGRSIRSDWRLLEVDDSLLQEIIDRGCATSVLLTPTRTRPCTLD